MLNLNFFSYTTWISLFIHSVQLKSFHVVISLYDCASYVILATDFLHSFESQNKFWAEVIVFENNHNDLRVSS